MRVHLARHGLADYESDAVSDDGGWLSREGRRQARDLGRRLSGRGISTVWSSPMSRAVQTAELAAGVLGVDVVIVREGLREYGVGRLAGTHEDEAAAIGPVFRAWADGDDAARIDGGEHVQQIVDRVREVLTEVARGDDEETLVVSHGGAIMATVPVLTGAPRSMAWDLLLDGGASVALRHGPEGWSREQDPT